MACVFHLYEHLHCRAGSLDIVDAQYGSTTLQGENVQSRCGGQRRTGTRITA